MPGTTIGKRYRLTEKLGGGSGGSVHRAHDLALDREIAVKLTHPQGPECEWRAGRRVIAPGVVRTLDLGKDASAGGYLTFDLARGVALTDWWQDQVRENAEPPWGALESVIEQLLEALGAIHQAGLLHLDLKPAHVLVAEPGPRITLLDLGLAQPLSAPSRGLTGTPHYTAPELARGVRPTKHADYFSLGACFYHALTGRPPHEGKDSRAILQAAAEGRHQALGEALAGRGIRAPAELVERIEGWLSPRPSDRGGARTRFAAGRVRTTFVGRAQALIEADAWLATGRGGLLRVIGDPGVGRSRFCAELADRGRQQGWQVLEIEGTDSLAAALSVAQRWAASACSPEPVAYKPSSGAPWEAVQAALARALASTLEALSAQLDAPLLLVLKEAVEAELLDIIEMVWRERGEKDGSLVAPSDRPGIGSHLQISPLDRDECGALLAQVLGRGMSRAALVERVHQHTKGRPGRIIALARRLDPAKIEGLPDENALALIDSHATLSRAAALAALAQLGPSHQELLEAAAVLARPVGSATLQHLVNATEAEIEEGLRELEQSGLLSLADNEHLRLASPEIAELVAEELGRIRAGRLHQRILACLPADAPVEQRVRHLLGAGLFAEALPLIRELAGDPLVGPGRARALTEQALELVDAGHELYPQAALAAATLALRSRNIAGAEAPASAAWKALLPGLRGSPLPTPAALLKGLTQLDPVRSELAVQALNMHCQARLESDDLAATAAVLEALLEQHGQAQRSDPELLRGLRKALGLALSNLGRNAEALEHLEAVVASSEAAGDPVALGYDLLALSQALTSLRRVDDAEKVALRAREQGESAGATPLTLRALHGCASLQIQRGRLEEAVEGLEKARTLAAIWGDHEILAMAELHLGGIATRRGQPEQALAIYDRVLPRIRDLNHALILLNLVAARARALELLGRPAEAIETLQEGVAVADQAGRSADAAFLRTNLAVNLLRTANHQEARCCLKAVDRVLPELRSPAHELRAAQIWTELEMVLQRWALAVAHIRRGLQLAPADVELAVRRMQVACRQGDAEAALEAFRALPNRDGQPSGSDAERMFILLEAELLLIEGHPAKAADIADQLHGEGSEETLDGISAGALWISGRAAMTRGLLPTALRMLSAAANQMERGAKIDRLPAKFDLVRALAASGKTEARNRLEQIGREIGDSAEEENLRAALALVSQEVEELLKRATAIATDQSAAFLPDVVRIFDEVLGGENLNELLPRLLDLTLDLMRGERGILFLIDPTTAELFPSVQRGVDGDTLIDARTWSEGVLKHSSRGQLVLYDDAHSAEELEGFDSIARFGILSVAAVPLFEEERAIGVVYVDSRQQRLEVSTDTRAAFAAMGRVFARLIRQTSESDRLRGEADQLRAERAVAEGATARYQPRGHWGKLIGGSEPMLELYAQAESILDHAQTTGRMPRLLITGPTGTGKGILAQEIARRTQRKYVTVNCASLTSGTAESALFGHRRGAFTDAKRDHKGYFEEAHGGVLFLDEIADADLSLQAKLLRALDDGEIYRMGETRRRQVDLWLISATNKSLPALINARQFREDLYFRLKVIEIRMPPLAKRSGDVQRLMEHSLAKHSDKYRLTRGARAALEAHKWPGNVRELLNVAERCSVAAKQGTIGVAELPEEVRQSAPGIEDDTAADATGGIDSLAQQEAAFYRRAVLAAAEVAGTNRVHLAHALGISTTKLRKLISRYEIPLPDPTRGRPPTPGS